MTDWITDIASLTYLALVFGFLHRPKHHKIKLIYAAIGVSCKDSMGTFVYTIN